MLDDVQCPDMAGFFDPTFFLYYEDVDLAWRARLRGWRCVYVPAARVLHVHSAIGGRSPASKSYRLGRNKVWTILKNYPALPLILCAPLIVSYDGLAVAYHLLRGNVHPLRGRLAALRDLPRVLAARRRIQARRTVRWTALVRAMTWRPRLR
jgi:GT2 family glycosyltransferase